TKGRRRPLHRAPASWPTARLGVAGRHRARGLARGRSPVRYPAFKRRNDPLRQDKDDHDHQAAVKDTLDGSRGEGAQDHRQKTKNDSSYDRPGDGSLAASEHLDPLLDALDEHKNIGLEVL